MKNKVILILSIIILLFFASCNKEESRLVDFLVEFATISKTESLITVHLDNGRALTPKNTSNLKLKDGDRVIINFTPLENGFININSIRNIFLGRIKEEGYPTNVEISPIKIISVWVSGSYLNMSFEVDCHSKAHAAGLLRNMQADKPTLYFTYSRRDDPPGAPTLLYASFDLGTLQKKKFTIFIKTHEGERKFDF